jgi:peptide/nickel transport system substrate-binding protein
VDLITPVPVETVKLLKALKGLTVHTGPARAPLWIGLNIARKPFDDVRVRQAVAGYGINREEIAKNAFFGYVQPLVSITPPGAEGHLDLTNMYPYNPEKARALLKEAGFDEKNPLKYTILIIPLDPAFATIATLMQAQLKKIGVDLRIELVDKLTWLDRVLRTGEFEQALIDSVAVVRTDAFSYLAEAGAPWNLSKHADYKVNELFHKLRITTDPAAQLEIDHALQKYLAENLYWISASGYPFVVATNDYVKGYEYRGQIKMRLEQVWLAK